MAPLKRIEITAAITGLCLALGCWLLGSRDMALAAALGGLFASINFRLLIWSWTGYMALQTPPPDPEASDLPPSSSPIQDDSTMSVPVVHRFVLKYAFLLLGILLLLGGLRVHLTGFLVGLGNVFLAAGFAPLLLKSKQPEPEFET